MNVTEKRIVKTLKHNVSLEEMWTLWTTSYGLKNFFGADSKVELEPLGAYEIYFLMDNKYGKRGSEGCKVLSFIHEKMLSFTWNAPPQFDMVRNSEYKTWVVVEFEDNLIRLSHLGWPEVSKSDEKEWNDVYDYFDEAWEYVLANLSEFVNS